VKDATTAPYPEPGSALADTRSCDGATEHLPVTTLETPEVDLFSRRVEGIELDMVRAGPDQRPSRRMHARTRSEDDRPGLIRVALSR